MDPYRACLYLFWMAGIESDFPPLLAFLTQNQTISLKSPYFVRTQAFFRGLNFEQQLQSSFQCKP